MIDFKSEGASTYEICQQVIQPYRSILSHVNAEGFHQGPVTIVISGNRPIDLIEHQTARWVFVDGRLSDMKSNQKPSSLIPWVSENWKNHFSWTARARHAGGRGQAPCVVGLIRPMIRKEGALLGHT